MEVRASSLRRNLARIRERVGADVALIPMVKADAYGLGVDRAIRALEPMDPWGWGVAAVEEGVALRALGADRPIVVFSPAPRGSLVDAVADGLIVSASDEGTLRALGAAAERLGREASFQVEVDTGMGRAGFDWRQATLWKAFVDEAVAAGLRWTGCYTHLHSADLEDVSSVRAQWERLQVVLSHLDPPEDDFMVHALNSAGALRCPEYAADAVRPGIFMYGGRAGAGLPDPEPVASVHARVVFTRDAPPGSTVGYGATHRAHAWERWATVAIGYGDGLPRALGNRGRALVRGRSVGIIGRISMDVTVVNISDVPEVEVGDAVTFIGSDGAEEITVDEVADLVGTISYEILTGFTPRVRRVWVDDGGS